ncbi:hypothetical protein [Flavobacterium capsici]|uniref:TonB C-terminal domain-containing protein n=1 Tax=Flavobacterium capsici TaxID=3075618 RepID=A0AA96J552_9FLAO|nr:MULTISPECIES: hypothetical protein [unclassified Flavobacterium]WNM19924.1 hypothetical protein RN608_04395 [Flavobacterium sp. PMR2A8]WNM21313.1 hypothetical protein RN605_11565 [Flavobacterium sp. PMTSA4]
MKKAIAFLLLYSSFSCSYFEKKVPSEKELLEQQMKEINWKEIDEYPTVIECEKISNEEERKQCFFEFLTETIQQKLAVDSLANLFHELDTIEVKVTIFPDSALKFEPQFPKDTVAYDTIKIDSILHSRLVDLPKIKPAIKRGIPVKTQFILPVILKME